MQAFGKTFIIIGIILIVFGGILIIGQKLGLGRLPGDILIKKENFTFFFPIVTCIIISIILSLILNLFKRL